MRVLPRLAALLLIGLAVTAPAAHAQRTVLSAGHVDAVAPVLGEDGVLSLRVKDGTAGGAPVFRDPDNVLFHVKPEAHMEVPDGLPPSYAFLGPAGSDIWLLPQVQDAELLWAGWSSETIPPGLLKNDALQWELSSVEGPGAVQLFDNGPFGDPRVFFDSADGLPDTETRAVGAHAHFNWVFHAAGLYKLHFIVSAETTSGSSTSLFAEYRFFVGDLADLPPEVVYIQGLKREYQPAATVELTAAQTPASRFDDYRWTRQCPGAPDPVQVASGPRYSFTATRAQDGCRVTVALYDGERELLRSYEALISIASGTWGPRTILSRGHTDVLNVSLENGRLRVGLKDDTGEQTVIRRPEEVLLHAKPQSALVLPEGLPSDFDFLGRAGDTIWLLPQAQQQDILWPGWETYGVPAKMVTDERLDWRLLSVEGPGALQLFTENEFGLPHVIFNSADGLPDAASMPASSHVHANWAFSRKGLYKLRFDLAAKLVDGGASVTSDPVEYWFFVGDLADLPAYPTDDAPADVPDDAPDDPVVDPPSTPSTLSTAAAPGPSPAATPTPPANTAPAKPTLHLHLFSASLRGRTLTLATRLSIRSRVTVTVRRGDRTVARAKARTVSASGRTLRVVLDRRLKPGRYTVRATATAGGRNVTRTIALRV